MFIENLLKNIASQTTTGLVNNALSSQVAKEQRDWQEEMWNKQNEYNHPVAMANRMRQAGLNPYTMTGAEPAGSAGTGAKADFIPLQDPLQISRQLADIENIRASTGKTLTETEKTIQEINNLQLLFDKEFITKEEMHDRLNLLREEWKKRNPYTLEADRIEAETNKLISETSGQQLQNDISAIEKEWRGKIRNEEYNQLIAKTASEWATQALKNAEQQLTNVQTDKTWQETEAIKEKRMRDAAISAYTLIIEKMKAAQAYDEAKISKLEHELKNTAMWRDLDTSSFGSFCSTAADAIATNILHVLGAFD